MNDEMTIYLPMTWPAEKRLDVESRLQRAALSEGLHLTEIGTTFNTTQRQNMRVMYFTLPAK